MNQQLRMIRVGLVGYGFGGAVFHAPFISRVEGLELCAIVERSGNRARKDYPFVSVCRSISELLQRDDVELVAISTPNSSHFALAKAALESGKHVVIDKPMTVTSAEAQELKRISETTGRIVSPYHNRRWDRNFRAIAGLVHEGRLGRLTEFQSFFDIYRPFLHPDTWRESPEPGSGLLYDLGPHLLDQAFALFGLPNSIYGELRRQRAQSLVDDDFTLKLAYDELQVILGASLARKSPRARFLAKGTLGTFPKQGGRFLHLRAGGLWIVHRFGALWPWATHSGRLRTVASVGEDYQCFYQNIRDAILGRAPLAITALDGWKVIRAIELAFESDRTKQALPWPK